MKKKDEDVIDITVSLDGSWHKRGHTSLYGFVSVIDILTGLVVHYIVLSKFCHMCSITAREFGEDTPEFNIWYEGHTSSGECNINYTGTSGGMEVEGAVRLWKRSVQQARMRYTTFLSDGDTKSYSELAKVKPYGPNINIEKEECVNHISKRMGTGLRNLVHEKKVGGKTLGGRGEGTLKDTVIKALHGYYYAALVNNIPNVNMRNAIMATLYHCASKDVKPNHQRCPKGVDSRSFYNKRKAPKEDLGTHTKMPIKLNEDVFKALLPLYKRLSTDELLSRCSRGATQNANESLHAAIWNKCPKTTFVSKQRVDLVITREIGEFNMGWSHFLAVGAQLSNEPVSKAAEDVASKLDKKRKAQSFLKSTAEFKKKRVQKKAAKVIKTSAHRTKGGPQYVPGGGD